MRILLVEDSDHLAGAVSRELIREYGHDVEWVRDPTMLEGKLDLSSFDVAIVDLLYEHLNRDFDARRLRGEIPVRGHKLLVTGLSALREISRNSDTRCVVWTSGEANRRLHLLFSFQDLGMRHYCSKNSGTGRLDTLEQSIQLAANGTHENIDPVLNPYLPTERSRKASEILLRDESKRSIWRAIAIGAHTRKDIATLTGYSARYIGSRIPEMFQNLREFDLGIAESSAPHVEIVRYVASNWQFFLDEAVRSMYP